MPWLELFTITAANGAADENGQSVIEFLIMLPVMIAMVIILVRVNTAVQISIVNQKYARSHTLALAFNSPIYPARRRSDGSPGLAMGQMVEKGYNRMVIGVSENAMSEDDGGRYSPKAVTQMVARSQTTSLGAGPDKEEPDRRSEVRVRTTVSLCSNTWVIQKNSGWVSYFDYQDQLGPDFSGSSFALCRSPLDE